MTPIASAKYVSIGSAALAVVLFVFWMITGGLNQAEQLLAATLIVMVHAVIALGPAVAIERGKAPPLMWVGISLAVTGALAWCGTIWLRGDERLVVAGTAASSLAGVVMVAGVALSQSVNTRLGLAARVVTIGLTGLLAVSILVFVFFFAGEVGWDARTTLHQQASLRVVSALSVLAIAGLLTTVLVPRLTMGTNAAPGGPSTVHMTCPRCLCRQSLRLGGGTCERCGLHIKVEIS